MTVIFMSYFICLARPMLNKVQLLPVENNSTYTINFCQTQLCKAQSTQSFHVTESYKVARYLFLNNIEGKINFYVIELSQDAFKKQPLRHRIIIR